LRDIEFTQVEVESSDEGNKTGEIELRKIHTSQIERDGPVGTQRRGGEHGYGPRKTKGEMGQKTPHKVKQRGKKEKETHN